MPTPRASIGAGPRTLHPDLVLVCVGVTLVMQLWRIPSLVPVIAPLRPMIVGGVLSVLLVLVSRDPERSLARFGTPVTLPLVALFALIVAGLPASLDPQLSLWALTEEMVPRLLLMLVILGSVRARADLDWLVLMTMAGLWFFTLMMMRAPVDGNAKGGWGNLVLYDNNDFALLAVSCLPLGAYLARVGAPRAQRLFGLASVLLTLYIVGRSDSRGGFLGMLAVAGFLALRFRALPARLRLGTVVAGLLAVAIVGGARYQERLATLLHPTQDYNWSGNDYNGRVELWKRGIGYMRDRPILGVGLYAYQVAEGELSQVARERLKYGKSMQALVAHNMFVQLGAELGVVALAVFAFLLWRAYRALRDIRRALDGTARAAIAAGAPPPAEHTLATALTASLLGYLVCGTFIAASYFTFLYVFLGLVAGLAKLAPVGRRAPAPAVLYPPAPAWGGALPPAR